MVVTKQPADAIANPTATIQFSAIDTSKELAPTPADRFAQFSATTHNQRLGFGLMLVKPIVELHCGTLSFESTIGRGSCVRVANKVRRMS